MKEFTQRDTELLHSQSKEELLVNSRDAGDDAEQQYAASEPHVDGLQEFTQWYGGAGQEEPSDTTRPLDRNTHSWDTYR